MTSEERLRRALIIEIHTKMGVEEEEVEEASCLCCSKQGTSRTTENDFKIALKPTKIDTDVEIARQLHREMEHRKNLRASSMTMVAEIRKDSMTNENDNVMDSKSLIKTTENYKVDSTRTENEIKDDSKTTDDAVETGLQTAENDNMTVSQTTSPKNDIDAALETSENESRKRNAVL